MSKKRTAKDRAKHWDPRIDNAKENQISSSFRCFQEMVNMQIEITSKNMTMEMDGDGAFAKLRLSFIAKIQWNSVHPTKAPLHEADSNWKQDPAAFNKYHIPPYPEIKSINKVLPNTNERPHLKKLQIDVTEQNLVNPDKSVNKKSAMEALKYLMIGYLGEGNYETNLDDMEGFKDFPEEVKGMDLKMDRYQLTQKYEFSIPTDFSSNLANYPYDQHTVKFDFMMSSSKLQAYDFDKYGVGEKVYLKWNKDEDKSFDSDDSSSTTSSSVSSYDSPNFVSVFLDAGTKEQVVIEKHVFMSCDGPEFTALKEILQKEKKFEIRKVFTGEDGIKNGSFTVNRCCGSKEPLMLDGKKIIVDFKKKGSNWEVKTESNPDDENEPKCSQFQILLGDLMYESAMQVGLDDETKAATGVPTAPAQKRQSLTAEVTKSSKKAGKLGEDCFKPQNLKKTDTRNVYYRCIPKKYHSQAYNEVNENIAEFDISPFTLKIEEVIDKLPKKKKKEVGGNMVDYHNKGDIEMEEDHFVEERENSMARQPSISQFATGSSKRKPRKIYRKQEKYYENSFALSFTLVRLVHNGVFSILFPLWVMLTLEPFVYLFEGDSVNEPYAYLITLLLAITGHRQVMQVKLESFVRTTSADWLFLVTVGSILAQMAILALYFHGGFNQSEHGHWLLADDVTRRRTAFFLHEGLILILITKSSWSMFKPLRLLRRPTKVSAILHGIKSNESLEEIGDVYEHGNLGGVDFKKYRELIGVKKYIQLDKTTSSSDEIFSLFGGNETLESKIEVKTFLSYNLKMTLSDEIPTDLFRIRCEEKMKKDVQTVFSGSNDMVKKMKDVNDTDNEGHISRVVYGVMFHSQPKAIALEMQFMKGDLKSDLNIYLRRLKMGRMEKNYKKFYKDVLKEDGQDVQKRTKKNIKQFGTVRSLVGAAKKIINDYRDWRIIQGLNIKYLLEAGKPEEQQSDTLTSAL
ncbi:hypothetical protein TrVE_jg14039 [Triparma verrucosa]|uniref:Uncharacterized protein n=1 Tax=Triparma verrucosa TaxID=1606542 RepID=A0A9W7BZY1_9STRA|nr:hypothetical protein TrVE_jg14039 [Triparma verrucosa]